MDFERLREKCLTAGQEHLLQFWDNLTPEQQQSLGQQIFSIELDSMNTSFLEAMHTLEKIGVKPGDRLEPPDPDILCNVAECSKERIEQYRRAGMAVLGKSEVAVLLFAGGQGSRLGAPGPKGTYDLGLPSGRTLYQLLAERILKLQRLVQAETGGVCDIPWYIMTSRFTNDETACFLEQHSYFGLKKENVVLFEQNLNPCFDARGKILLESPSDVAFAPAGNGDMYRAIQDTGVLKDLSARAVKFVHVCCVDNILLKVADPLFVGFCHAGKISLGVHTVERTVPTEPLSVICKVNGTYRAVHYYEFTKDVSERRDNDGKLYFNAGIIGDLVYSTEFLDYLCRTHHWSNLRYHVAYKTIPWVDSSGLQRHRPETPNGIKLEKYLFDDVSFPRNMGIWNGTKEEDFATLKNAEGKSRDTPSTCRKALMDLHRRYVEAAGGGFLDSVSASATGSPNTKGTGQTASVVVCEISPLVSYNGEGLKDIVEGKVFVPPLRLELAPDNSTILVTQANSQS